MIKQINQYIIIFVFSTLLTLVLCYHSFIADFKRSALGDTCMYNHIYTTYVINRNILESRPLFDSRAFYPSANSLLYWDPSIFQSVLILPIFNFIRHNPNIVYNSIIILMTFLKILFALWCGWRIAGSLLLGVLFSIIVNANPYITFEFPRFHIYFYGFIILIVYILIELLNKYDYKKYLALGALLVLQTYSSFNHLFFVSLILFIFFLILIFDHDSVFKNKSLKAFILSIGCFFIINIPLLIKVQESSIGQGVFGWTPADYYNIPIKRYFTNFFSNLAALSLNNFNVYPMLLIVFIPVFGIIRIKQKIKLFLLLSVLFLIVSNLDIVYFQLIRVFPFSMFRSYFRSIELLFLLLAYIAFYSMNNIFQKLNSTGKFVFGIIILLFFLNIGYKAYKCETLTTYKRHYFKTEKHTPEHIKFLKSKSGSVLLYLPCGIGDYMYLEDMLFQNNYLANGFLEIADYHTEYNFREIDILNSFPSIASLKLIDKKKINFIIIKRTNISSTFEIPRSFKIAYIGENLLILEKLFSASNSVFS